jgi:transposase
MNKLNVIGVDLAKKVFQVCTIGKHDKVLSNKQLRAKNFEVYLAIQSKCLVVFEACGRAHHCARIARRCGHEVMILPAQWVAAFRQGQKTDRNDALAIAIAAKQPKVKTVAILDLDQQGLQSDSRVHQHVSDELTATGNMLRGLLAEFGIEINKGHAALKRSLPLILEDAENELPIATRESLNIAWQLWQILALKEKALKKLLTRRAEASEPCQRLMKIEGVGIINALGLYIEMGDATHFKNGRSAAACIGVTPKQHSSGGKVKLGSIGKYCGNQRLRSSLITGAHSVIQAIEKRGVRNEKERWLKNIVERRGKGRAAVALANKTVRTAWAMLYNNEYYNGSTTLTA